MHSKNVDIQSEINEAPYPKVSTSSLVVTGMNPQAQIVKLEESSHN